MYPYPAWPDAPWDAGAIEAGAIIPQNVTSATVPFSECMGQHDPHTIARRTSALLFNELIGLDDYDYYVLPSSG